MPSRSRATSAESAMDQESLVHQTPTREGKSIRAWWTRSEAELDSSTLLMVATLSPSVDRRLTEQLQRLVLLREPPHRGEQGVAEDGPDDDALHRPRAVAPVHHGGDLAFGHLLHHPHVEPELVREVAVAQAGVRGEDADRGVPRGVLVG